MSNEKTLLYLNKESMCLADRWLQDNNDSPPVTIITTESSKSQAGELKSYYSNVHEVIVISGDIELSNLTISQLAANLKNATIDNVILPVSVNTVPLRFIENVNIPDLRPFYSISKMFWGLGAKHLQIYNLHGANKIYIPHFLDQFKNIHKGQRCFIVGNGPSLRHIDMTRLKNEITFGSNRCYLGYEDWGFSFKYWGIMDRLQIEEYYKDYETHFLSESTNFLPFEYLPLLRIRNSCPVNHLYGAFDFPKFADTCDKIYLGYTVTYMLIQIAAIMGCSPIILIGVDHRYNLKNSNSGNKLGVDFSALTKLNRVNTRIKKRVKKSMAYRIFKYWRHLKGQQNIQKPLNFEKRSDLWTSSDALGETHFNSVYTMNKRFIPPRIKEQEIAFSCAENWAQENGINILNATPGSALKIFPQIDYINLF